MGADEYYYNKFLEWQSKGNGDYRVHLRRVRRLGLATEFRQDPNFRTEVCSYLKAYAQGQEKDTIMSVIEGITNPDRDILEIIIGATLDACYPNSNVGNALVGLAIAGLIGAALIGLLGNKK